MKKVVIIGAGPAGLTTAYELLNKSDEYEVVILESDKQVGGISKTVSFDGYRVDTGIHRFFSKSDKVNEIWNEVVPLQNKPAYDDICLNRERDFKDEGTDPEKDEVSMLIRDRFTRIYYDSKFYDYPVSLNWQTIKNMGFFTLMKAGFSYLKTIFYKLPETSLENFYINRFGKVLYSMFFEKYTEKVWGRSPSEISADWGAQRVKGISISAVLKDWFRKIFRVKKAENTETSLIEQFVYPKLGAGQIWEEMAKHIEEKNGQIILNAKVKNIIIENEKIVAVEYEKNGKVERIGLDICVSSMPLKDLVHGMKGIDIPENIENIAQGLPYREFMSVCMVVNKFNLKNNTKIKTMGDIIPDSWIYVQEPSVKMGRLQVFNNWSPYIFKDKTQMDKKVLVAFEYFCSETDEWWNMSDEEFIEFAKNDAQSIGLIDKDDVEAAIRIKIPKAYPAYFDTYSEIDKLIEYLNKFDNLYCIGRNGQHRYNNMDHSMLTGIECVDNILNNKENKNDIWNVNTEKKYHESK